LSNNNLACITNFQFVLATQAADGIDNNNQSGIIGLNTGLFIGSGPSIITALKNANIITKSVFAFNLN